MEDDNVGDANCDSLTLFIYTRRTCPFKLRGSGSPLDILEASFQPVNDPSDSGSK